MAASQRQLQRYMLKVLNFAGIEFHDFYDF